MIDKVTWSHAFLKSRKTAPANLVWLIAASQVSQTKAVTKMPLTKARLKGMKKFAVFYGLG